MTMTPIQKAIAVCDNSKAALARSVGVSPAVVWQWANGRRPIPAHWCAAIEEATRGVVTCKDLRPDVFREPTAVSGEQAA